MFKTFNKQLLNLKIDQSSYHQYNILDLKDSRQDVRLDLKSSPKK